MSIIHDALKKTQNHLNVPLHPQEEKQKQNGIWIIALLILLGLLGLSLLSFLIIPPKTKKKQVPKAFTQKAVIPVQQGQSIIKPAVKKPTPLPLTQRKSPRLESSLILNGIMTMGAEHLALINNQILKKGDTIEGKTIISITENTVELSDNGKISILKTGN